MAKSSLNFRYSDSNKRPINNIKENLRNTPKKKCGHT